MYISNTLGSSLHGSSKPSGRHGKNASALAKEGGKPSALQCLPIKSVAVAVASRVKMRKNLFRDAGASSANCSGTRHWRTNPAFRMAW